MVRTYLTYVPTTYLEEQTSQFQWRGLTYLSFCLFFPPTGLKSRGIAPEKIASWQTAAHYQVCKGYT